MYWIDNTHDKADSKWPGVINFSQTPSRISKPEIRADELGAAATTTPKATPPDFVGFTYAGANAVPARHSLCTTRMMASVQRMIFGIRILDIQSGRWPGKQVKSIPVSLHSFDIEISNTR